MLAEAFRLIAGDLCAPSFNVLAGGRRHSRLSVTETLNMLRHGAPPSDIAELVIDVAQPGDTEAIAILRRAAAETGRMSPTVASQLSRRALELTAPGDPVRGALTAETLAYLIYAGQAAEAVKLITAGAGDLTDPLAEAEARLGLAHLELQYAPADVVEQCQRALQLPGLSAELRTYLLSFLSLGLNLYGDVTAADEAARDATETARASGNPDYELFTLVPRASQALARGNWELALDLTAESATRLRSVQGSTVRLRPPPRSRSSYSTRSPLVRCPRTARGCTPTLPRLPGYC